MCGFDAETKSIIYNYLEAIAHADEELADDEANMLQNLREIWSIDVL